MPAVTAKRRRNKQTKIIITTTANDNDQVPSQSLHASETGMTFTHTYHENAHSQEIGEDNVGMSYLSQRRQEQLKCLPLSYHNLKLSKTPSHTQKARNRNTQPTSSPTHARQALLLLSLAPKMTHL